MNSVLTKAAVIAKRFEGFSAVAYLCPAGYWTIGWGHICRANHPPISQTEAAEYLLSDLSLAYSAVAGLVKTPLADSQVAALLDFVFNVGRRAFATSALLAGINRRNPEASSEFHRWVYGGGRKLLGLVRRRMVEADMFEAEEYWPEGAS